MCSLLPTLNLLSLNRVAFMYLRTSFTLDLRDTTLLHCSKEMGNFSYNCSLYEIILGSLCFAPLIQFDMAGL